MFEMRWGGLGFLCLGEEGMVFASACLGIDCDLYKKKNHGNTRKCGSTVMLDTTQK